MQSLRASTAVTSGRTSLHLALAGFADEVVGTLARLFAYVGALALLAILGLAAVDQLPDLHDEEPALQPSWSVSGRSPPAFALSGMDPSEKSASYTIFRHPGDGRRDVLRWAGGADQLLAELEIYRPGDEFDAGQSPVPALAGRIGDGTRLEAAGLIDSKFGPVALYRQTGAAKDAPSCLGYFRRSDGRLLQISGFSCQGDTLPARRAAIACTLNRLTLLTAGSDPRLAELFAHAELNRRPCSPTVSPDWLLGAENAQLRGTL
jgi:hypothetical protein